MKYLLVFIVCLYCSQFVYSKLQCIDLNKVPKDYFLLIKYAKTAANKVTEKYMKMSNTDE